MTDFDRLHQERVVVVSVRLVCAISCTLPLHHDGDRFLAGFRAGAAPPPNAEARHGNIEKDENPGGNFGDSEAGLAVERIDKIEASGARMSCRSCTCAGSSSTSEILRRFALIATDARPFEKRRVDLAGARQMNAERKTLPFPLRFRR